MTGRTELLRFFLDKSKNKFSILSSYFYRKDTLMNRLQDKVAIITGASSGVGKCIAESFAAEGAKVMLFARKENLLTEIVNDIKAKGGEASFLAGSVTDQKAVEEVFKKTVDAYGKVDIVVNDAGIGGYYGAADVPDKECYDLFDTNAMGSRSICSRIRRASSYSSAPSAACLAMPVRLTRCPRAPWSTSHGRLPSNIIWKASAAMQSAPTAL